MYTVYILLLPDPILHRYFDYFCDIYKKNKEQYIEMREAESKKKRNCLEEEN